MHVYMHVYIPCTFMGYVYWIYLYIGVGRPIQGLLQQQSGGSPLCALITTCLAFIPPVKEVWSNLWDFAKSKCPLQTYAKPWNMTSCFVLCAEGNLPRRAETYGFQLAWIKLIVVSGRFQQRASLLQPEVPRPSRCLWRASVVENQGKNGAREARSFSGYSVLLPRSNGSRISWPGGSIYFINNLQWTSSNKVAWSHYFLYFESIHSSCLLSILCLWVAQFHYVLCEKALPFGLFFFFNSLLWPFLGAFSVLYLFLSRLNVPRGSMGSAKAHKQQSERRNLRSSPTQTTEGVGVREMF